MFCPKGYALRTDLGRVRDLRCFWLKIWRGIGYGPLDDNYRNDKGMLLLLIPTPVFGIWFSQFGSAFEKINALGVALDL